MSYGLNKKRVLKIISINFSFLLLLILINFVFVNSSDIEKLRMTAGLMAIGIPIFIIFTGSLGVISVLFLNLRILFYKNKNILTINNNSIIYDSFMCKKIVIQKENIDRIYTTFHNDDYMIRNKYIVIVARQPIEQLKKDKLNILKIFRIKSDKNLLYINVSELKECSEKIATDIERTLSIPIKKKSKDLYFGKDIFLGDKL